MSPNGSPNGADRTPNGRQVVAKFRQLCELIANFVPVCCQRRASWSPTARECIAKLSPIFARCSPTCANRVAKRWRDVAKRSPNACQFSPVVRVGHQHRASWSPTACECIAKWERNSQTPFEHCAQLGSGLILNK